MCSEFQLGFLKTCSNSAYWKVWFGTVKMCVQNTHQAVLGWATYRCESMKQCVVGVGNSRDQATAGVTTVWWSSAQSGCGSGPINNKIWTIHLLRLSLPINFFSLPQPLSLLCTLKATCTSHKTVSGSHIYFKHHLVIYLPRIHFALNPWTELPDWCPGQTSPQAYKLITHSSPCRHHAH